MWTQGHVCAAAGWSTLSLLSRASHPLRSFFFINAFSSFTARTWPGRNTRGVSAQQRRPGGQAGRRQPVGRLCRRPVGSTQRCSCPCDANSCRGVPPSRFQPAHAHVHANKRRRRPGGGSRAPHGLPGQLPGLALARSSRSSSSLSACRQRSAVRFHTHLLVKAPRHDCGALCPLPTRV